MNFFNNLYDFILEEPRKLSINMNEGHPGLLESLHINNNKLLLPIQTEQIMSKNSSFLFFL